MAKLKQIPELTAWLKRVASAEKPPKSVIAFNIGLIETENGFSAYLIGAKEFDEDDPDWACGEAFTFTERYCPIAKSGFKNWEDVQRAAVATAKAFLKSAEGKKSFLTSATAVTVGFDDGDLERVK